MSSHWDAWHRPVMPTVDGAVSLLSQGTLSAMSVVTEGVPGWKQGTGCMPAYRYGFQVLQVPSVRQSTS